MLSPSFFDETSLLLHAFLQARATGVRGGRRHFRPAPYILARFDMPEGEWYENEYCGH